jgi:superfamily II DNA or RNA helicase
MAEDKQQKRKKKRAEKVKARRQSAERQARHEKAEDYEWQARNAYQARDYREALKWALKKLALVPTDSFMKRVVLSCAEALKDDVLLLRFLREIYREGGLRTRDEHLLLGRLALAKKDYGLAREVLAIVAADAVSPSPRFKGRLAKARLKDLERELEYCRIMETHPHDVRPQAPKAAQPAAQPAASRQTLPEAPSAPAAAARPGPAASGLETAQEKPPELKVEITSDAQRILEAVQTQRKSSETALQLALKAYKLSFRSSYDQLVCLPTLREVKSLWYQEETARKVMKTFRGRAILADEVGLGKTIEAGLIFKEYLMRGLIHSALVLTPSSLVNQWREELTSKFGIPCVSTHDPLFRQDPERFWQEPFILASIQTSRSKRHFAAVTSRSYDLVVVDEAHHLKNRTTLNWKLVNAIPKTFLLMLTATPVQNSLEELYNLVTLLRPGHLKTQKAFKEEFVTRGNPTDPQNREKLRQLLKEVMVRNTRAITQLRLPPRFATTVRVLPSAGEDAFYQGVSSFVAQQNSQGSRGLAALSLKRLLAAVGSSHAAALRRLERLQENAEPATAREIEALLALGRSIRTSGKLEKVVELLRASRQQKIIFVNHLATLEFIQRALQDQGISYAVYHGGLNAAEKQAAIDAFRAGRTTLLATGAGGEGHNLQFCHVMINYDLPWNPMEIEQRIGRLHRIGQEQEVQVYNFCAAGSIEDRILDILDRKINLFELVVGEVDMILGRLQGEEEFDDMVYDIWVKHAEETERHQAFEALAARLKRARSAYEKSKELDEKLFREDFGI